MVKTHDFCWSPGASREKERRLGDPFLTRYGPLAFFGFTQIDVPMEIVGIQWEISRILKWMHVSTIFLAIWIGGISPYIALTWALYMVGHCRGVTDLTSDDFWWVCWMGQSLIPCCTPHWHDPWGENSKRNGRDDLWTCTYHHLSPSWDVWCNKSSNVEILATTRILH
jgi:hypothetical protein